MFVPAAVVMVLPLAAAVRAAVRTVVRAVMRAQHVRVVGQAAIEQAFHRAVGLPRDPAVQADARLVQRKARARRRCRRR